MAVIEPIKIFYCYAPQDRKLRDELEKHLMSLKRLGKITLRLNREILAGTDWSYEEDRRFQAADLILLLISPDFINSDYHYGIEMHHALEKHKAGNVCVIPIILRPTALWEKTPIGRLQALPKDGKAITEQRKRDAAFVDIVKEISEVVATLLTRRQEIAFATKADEGKFLRFTQVIGSSCASCGARNPLGVITCENCGDLLLTNDVAKPMGQILVETYRSGLQALISKNYVEAINQFKLVQSLNHDRQSYEVTYNLACAYQQYGQSLKDKDKALYQENLKLAAEEFELAAKTEPDALDAYFQLGMCYHDLELYPQAMSAFKQALKIAPRDSAIYYQLGQVAIDQGYNVEAEAYFLEGLKLTPDHALILIALGCLYMKMNRPELAINVLRQATQHEPALWEGWYELGRAHMKAKEWKLALSALNQARQQSPDNSDIYSAMASCFLKMNKRAEARQMVRESLQCDPNNVGANRIQKQL